MNYEQTIVNETMSKTGFLWRLRENSVDDLAFARLLEGVNAARVALHGNERLNRRLVACLFEAPWEIENTVPHYRSRDEAMRGYLVGKRGHAVVYTSTWGRAAAAGGVARLRVRKRKR